MKPPQNDWFSSSAFWGSVGSGESIVADRHRARGSTTMGSSSDDSDEESDIHILSVQSHIGIEGVITGRALYEGKLDLAAAIQMLGSVGIFFRALFKTFFALL